MFHAVKKCRKKSVLIQRGSAATIVTIHGLTKSVAGAAKSGKCHLSNTFAKNKGTHATSTNKRMAAIQVLHHTQPLYKMFTLGEL